MEKTEPSCLYSGNAGYLEELYERFLTNPDSVDLQWREYFAEIQPGTGVQDIPHSSVQSTFRQAALNRSHKGSERDTGANAHSKQVSVIQFIGAHRIRGHHQADLDPLKQHARPQVPELDPAYHNLHESDMDSTFNTGSLVAPDEISLREIIDIVKSTYCRTIGAEYMHITETEQKRWIQERLESCLGKPEFPAARKIRILETLIAASLLESISIRSTLVRN